jgi:hypothetical protein
MVAVKRHTHLEDLCHAVEQRLEKLARQHCRGEITDDAFLAAVLAIEAQEVTPIGLTLTASRTRDRWTVFKIKMNGTNETCASFEFLPETGEFRRDCSECDG